MLQFHRLMMSACSSHMKTVLDREDLSSSVDIHMPESVSIEAIYCFLHYIYTGSLSLTINTAQAVLKIATILQVIKVQQHCKQFIENIAGKLGLNPTLTQSTRFTVSREEETIAGRPGDRRTIVIPDSSAFEPAGYLPRMFGPESAGVSSDTQCNTRDRPASSSNVGSSSMMDNTMNAAKSDMKSCDTSLSTYMNDKVSFPTMVISQRNCNGASFATSSVCQFSDREQTVSNCHSSAEFCQSESNQGNTDESSNKEQWSRKVTNSGIQGNSCVEGREEEMVRLDTGPFIKQEPCQESDVEPCVFFEEQQPLCFQNSQT